MATTGMDRIGRAPSIATFERMELYASSAIPTGTTGYMNMTENDTKTMTNLAAEHLPSKEEGGGFDAIMLDLETMSVKVTAAIIQIGACAFNSRTGAIGASILIDVDLHSSILAGGDVDDSTVKWWRDRGGLRLEAPRNIHVAMEMFKKWYAATSDSLNTISPSIYAQGSHFDAAVLGSAYERAGRSYPWPHYTVRDTRTIYDIAYELGWKKPPGEVAHQALDDCKAQVKTLVSALEVIRATSSPNHS